VGPGGFHDAEGVVNFTAQSERLLVDDEQIRRERFGRVTDDGRAQLEHFGDIHVETQRRILAAA
jgi:hypothetical protein